MTQSVGSDEDALAASLADPARFAVLFERYVDAIYRYLSFRVGADMAEDLTAETFAWRQVALP
jgi:DNA-directed RNA polymerase specialized sigma24 family protein